LLWGTTLELKIIRYLCFLFYFYICCGVQLSQQKLQVKLVNSYFYCCIFFFCLNTTTKNNKCMSKNKHILSKVKYRNFFLIISETKSTLWESHFLEATIRIMATNSLLAWWWVQWKSSTFFYIVFCKWVDMHLN
jgi:hypothetical protein